MPIIYSGPVELLNGAASRVEQVLERAGLLQEDFLVGVTGIPGSNSYDVMIINLGRMCSRVYRLSPDWEELFAREVESGVFAGERI